TGPNARVTNIELSDKASPPDDDVVVDVRDVNYGVDSRLIFQGLSLKVRRGRITAIMGPSGTGKTTLLRLITAQSYPSKGQLVVFGQDIEDLGGSASMPCASAWACSFRTARCSPTWTFSRTSRFPSASTLTCRSP